jgi:predicted ester cyclase
MIAGLMRYDGQNLSSMAMERFWREGFLWFGPGPIGTGRGLKGFQDVHQRAFLSAFPDRVGGDHKCRIADGAYVGSTGWPSIRATHTGPGFMRLPASGRAITMRVMDFWRREDDLLAENWVFIDIPDLLRQLGIDAFAA